MICTLSSVEYAELRICFINIDAFVYLGQVGKSARGRLHLLVLMLVQYAAHQLAWQTDHVSSIWMSVHVSLTPHPANHKPLWYSMIPCVFRLCMLLIAHFRHSYGMLFILMNSSSHITMRSVVVILHKHPVQMVSKPLFRICWLVRHVTGCATQHVCIETVVGQIKDIT